MMQRNNLAMLLCVVIAAIMLILYIFSMYNRMMLFADYNGGVNTFNDIIFVLLGQDMKNKYCEVNNINLLRIPYTEFENIENILKQAIN